MSAYQRRTQDRAFRLGDGVGRFMWFLGNVTTTMLVSTHAHRSVCERSLFHNAVGDVGYLVALTDLKLP